MLKKLKKSIRQQLLKIDWFKRAVADYRLRMKKKRHKLRWDLLMNSGQVRNLKPEKLEPFDTLGIVTDDGVLEEYQNGKVVGRESLFINSMFIDSEKAR
jgi:hypothetical protein